MVSVPGLFPGWLLQPPGCFPCLHSYLLTLSFSWNIQGNHHGCKSHHMFLCPKPSLTVHGIQTEIGVTVALVPVWSGPCHLPYLFILPLPSLSESNSSGLISVSWIRPAKLCLGVPGVLSLASHLPPFLSPLGSRDLTQAFPDYVYEVTSILSTSIFFLSFIALLSKQPFAFIYLLIYICLCTPSRVKTLLLCYMSSPFPQSLACGVWICVGRMRIRTCRPMRHVQWENQNMSSNARTGNWPHKTLRVDSLPFAVSHPLSPAVTWDHLPNRPLVFGGKNVCVCVCDLREPTVWGGRLTWKQIMTSNGVFRALREASPHLPCIDWSTPLGAGRYSQRIFPCSS